MRIWIGGVDRPDRSEIRRALEGAGHEIVAASPWDLAVWLHDPRGAPPPGGKAPLLAILADEEPELSSAAAFADDWLCWPRDREQLPLRIERLDKLLPRRSVDEMLQRLAHELNNPLACLLANLELLARYLPEGDARRLHQDAVHGAERLRDLVADLAGSFGRRAADEPLDLREVLESSIRVLGPALLEQTTLLRNYEPVPPVLGNASRLGQVFFNLLRNALQALRPGTPSTNRIELTLASRGSEVVVEIRDNGKGIRPEDLDRIFEPFFTTRSASGGKGLGLSIARSIVESAGGRIEAESEPERGSCFRVVLPAGGAR